MRGKNFVVCFGNLHISTDMSLYDDIVDNKPPAPSDASGWNAASVKLFQSQQKLRRATLTKTQKDRDREKAQQGAGRNQGGPPPVMSPVINLGGRKQQHSAQTFMSPFIQDPVGMQESPFPLSAAAMEAGDAGGPDAGVNFNVENEYDPFYPNEYELIKERQRKERAKQREEERQREREERERRRLERREADRQDRTNRSRDSDSDNSDEEESGRGKGRVPAGTGAAIAPPTSLLGGPDSDPERGGPRPGGGAAIAPPPSIYENTDPQDGANKAKILGFAPGMGKNSVAARIMQKYGFKEGQGLGRQGQGMARALEVEKTSKRGGKILSERELMEKEAEKEREIVAAFEAQKQKEEMERHQRELQEKAKQNLAEVMKKPTKVVLLKNMVGKGQVDEDLEPEVAEECHKYGTVTKVLIFEIPGAEDHEAVRIFIEFERMESAIKALVDLNGRFFGGRTVTGSFYDVDRFRALELND